MLKLILSVTIETSASSPPAVQNRVSFLRFALAAFALWLGCFFGLGAAGVFDLDEGLYTSVARQMVESGNWVVPRVGLETFFDKPPLFYWCEAVCVRVLGATSFAVRLPSATATALTALALWWWCRRRANERTGWIAAALFLSCPLAFGLARQAVLDSLLTLFLSLAVLAWIEANGSEGREQKRAYLWMAVAMGCAVMTKGIIGALLPGAALVLWLLLRREEDAVRRVPWLLMLGIIALINAPWHIAMWRATGHEFVQQYIIHNHVDRFLGKDFKHNAPFWTYLPVLLVGMFPWSVLVPLSWWRGWNARRANRSQPDMALAMCALWAAVVFVFFSISKSKLPSYVEPAVPALCILIAARLEALWSRKEAIATPEAFVLSVLGTLLGIILLVVGAMGLLWRGMINGTVLGRMIAPKAVSLVCALSPITLCVGAALLLGCAAMTANRAHIARLVGIGTAMGAFLIGTLAGVGLPIWNAREIAPLHDLARQSLPDLNRGRQLVLFAFKPGRPSVRFVVGHPAQITATADANEMRAVLRKARGGLILTKREQVLPPLPFPVRIEASNQGWTLWNCAPKVQ